MMPSFRILPVTWPEGEHEGAVWYEVAYADGDFEYFRQPFRQGPATRDTKGKPVWGWSGDRTNLSLTGAPVGTDSYDCTNRHGTRLHVTWQGGRCIVSNDCTATLQGPDTPPPPTPEPAGEGETEGSDTRGKDA